MEKVKLRRVRVVLEETEIDLDGNDFEKEMEDALCEERDYLKVDEKIVTYGNEAYLSESDYLQKTKENIEWREENYEQYEK